MVGSAVSKEPSFAVRGQVVCTISIRSKLDNVANSDVDNAKEALILLLELLLVKYLDC